ncbi:MAG: hypothetical protein QNJ68_06105 [Microcoleaceae cyanobacterium MO_207.B10]|nr:hypothetical protein [Microcoleaceae cyanobacterium MO_207.B10]
MTEQNIKRSIIITLVLISSISITACASRKRREVYKSLEDCRKEWGGVEKCELITDSSYPPGYYYGPYYYSSGGSSSSSGRTYYYRNSSGRYQPVPSNAGIVKSRSGRSTTSVGTVNRGGFGSRGGRGGSSFGSRGGGKG